ncbi:MAG: ABC transporter permease [Bacteroidia bacterium]
MRFYLNITQSLDSIRANIFRAGVTIFIIALGITALVVVMTSIEGIKAGMSESFSSLGSNTFRIENRSSQITIGGSRGRRPKAFPPITYREAQAFQEQFGPGVPVSITGSGGSISQVKYQQTETNPNIQLIGTDQHYLKTARFTVLEGRSISSEDVALARNVVVLGHEVKEKLFPFEFAPGNYVNVDGNIYKVIGVFERMGTTGMSGADRSVVVPISTLRSKVPSLGSLTLNVFVEDANGMEAAMAEARGRFRAIRGLRLELPDNFSVAKSDEFVSQLIQQLGAVTLSATFIALITLLGASVALLNVMLVSVTERTNEIGLRKALGATRGHIQGQFLWEAIVICQLGGVLGVLMGVIGGNIVSNLAFKGTFVVPWGWMFIGLFACFVVGLGSGFYPAWKAARVDPIRALQHV